MAGPNAKNRNSDDTYSRLVRSMKTLVGAWDAIRRNAETSRQARTRNDAREFAKDLPSNLRAIQDQLRKGYKFKPAFGATPSKGKGKSGKRPIVVAPLEDRIVQRAILDVLQQAEALSGVKTVLATPTSIGGIRGRGTDDAVRQFQARVDAGDKYVAGSDIAGFFQKIQRTVVVQFLRADCKDDAFVGLFERALTVELQNENELSEIDRRMFPTGLDGVAQGCPLSAFAGNVVLQAFDTEMNDRGITCIRYIDDFIVTGKSKASVQKAMRTAEKKLAVLGMEIYNCETHPTKAFAGPIGEPHNFLGYKLVPNSYPPSDAACERLVERIEDAIKVGKLSIRKAVEGRAMRRSDLAYAQTIAQIDLIVRGWRASFRATQATKEFKALDKTIDRRVHDFTIFFKKKAVGSSDESYRRALGISLAIDVPVDVKVK
ncbi:reverse transcriptase domain-containing protein [Sphingorhabdus contaminans]|uniref:reverse transcriptase domain-containing protein n=1 Tax=Sphingorhabdus contaminans TaxID=1343899 RepID=UPI003D2B9068